MTMWGATRIAGPPNAGNSETLVLHGGGAWRTKSAARALAAGNGGRRPTLLVRRDEIDVYESDNIFSSIEIIPSDVELKSARGPRWLGEIRSRKAAGVVAILDASGEMNFRTPLLILASGAGKTWLVDVDERWFELSAAGLYFAASKTAIKLLLSFIDSALALILLAAWVAGAVAWAKISDRSANVEETRRGDK